MPIGLRFRRKSAADLARFWLSRRRFSINGSKISPKCCPNALRPPPKFPVSPLAADIIDDVLHKRRTLDEQVDGRSAHPGFETPQRSRPRTD